MKTTAAVLVELGRDLELVDLEIPTLAPGQLLVEVEVSGICRTQLLESRGRRGADPWLPHCLGHEGVGRVLEVGDEVTKVKPGDRVVLTWIQGEGQNVGGVQYGWSGRGSVNAGAVTTFQQHAVVSENRVVPVPSGVARAEQLPLELTPLLGCAVPTGFGAVFNTAAVRGSESIVVLGVGGVGACAIAAARAAGCTHIVAVDVNPEKLAVAEQVGATETVISNTDIEEVLLAEAPGGFDVAIEASGRSEVMALALSVVRPRGGTAVVVGNASADSIVAIDPRQLNQGKRLVGTWGGDCCPDRDIPRFARDIASDPAGLLANVGPWYALEQVNEALADLEGGRVLRPLLQVSGKPTG